MASDYRKEDIVQVAVPQWRHHGDSQWIREWDLQLEVPLLENWEQHLGDLSGDGIDVVAELRQDGQTLHLTTMTRLEPLTDQVFFVAAYRMLQRVDQTIGRIAQIQGQPREVWMPFRQRS